MPSARLVRGPAILLASALLACGAEPPYRRLLQGEDARKAAALEERIDGLWAAGKFAEAVTPAEELLALRRRLQGEGHWQTTDAARQVRTLQAAANLAEDQRRALAAVPNLEDQVSALEQRARYKEAEPLLHQILAVRQQALGRKHPDTAESLNNLASNLNDQGRFKEAEALYRRALAVREEVLGPDHPHTAVTYTHLACNLDDQGRHREAEPLNRKALAVRQRVLGPRHPLTALSYNNLAANLHDLGRDHETEPLYRQALALFEEALGPRHPRTALAYNNLATNLDKLGRHREAEPLYRQALAVREEVLGPTHPDTAQSYNNLGSNLDSQGRLKESEVLYRHALALRRQVLGPAHPDTAQSYNNLAYNLWDQGRYEEAEALFRQALAVDEKALGPHHPATARDYNNLACNLRARGRDKEAEPLFRKALALRQEMLGPRHPLTALSSNNLAANRDTLGRAQDAELLYRQALALRREVLGPNHPDTARSCNDLAANLQRQGHTVEAEPLWRTAAEGIEAARLRVAASSLDRAAAIQIQPHIGLAACRARLGRATEAWHAAEAGLARGLLDDLTSGAAYPTDAESDRRDRDRAAEFAALDKALTPLLAAERLSPADRRRRDELLGQRARLDQELARRAAERSARAVLPLESVQARLASDEALLLWVDLHTEPGAVDPRGDHWAGVLRNTGSPAWVRLSGSGAGGAWTDADDRLPRLLRDDLSHGEPQTARHARRLARQRLEPLAPHLAGVGHLIVVPAGIMAGVPVEALTDRYRISYAPSGSVLARLRGKHRALRSPTLLALGDPNFDLPASGTPNPARSKPQGQELADAHRGEDVPPLPGTRREVTALAALLPPSQSTLLLGSDASQQRLDELAVAGKLKDFRLIHLATHGTVDPISAAHSALQLARDRLPSAQEQARRAAAGQKVYAGRLTVADIARDWQLDADLVTLSACETALGPAGGGEGLLGFAQVLLGRGARSLALSLWKVDDTATALLMSRFYQNLLGQRQDLQAPLPKALALQEARSWLRGLSRAEVERLSAQLLPGRVRATQEKGRWPGAEVAESVAATSDHPFGHPRYWAAFILIGDPD